MKGVRGAVDLVFSFVSSLCSHVYLNVSRINSSNCSKLHYSDVQCKHILLLLLYVLIGKNLSVTWGTYGVASAVVDSCMWCFVTIYFSQLNLLFFTCSTILQGDSGSTYLYGSLIVMLFASNVNLTPFRSSNASLPVEGNCHPACLLHSADNVGSARVFCFLLIMDLC